MQSNIAEALDALVKTVHDLAREKGFWGTDGNEYSAKAIADEALADYAFDTYLSRGTVYGIVADAVVCTKAVTPPPQNDGEKLMLVVSELGEALEALRKGNGPSAHIPAFTAVEEELADAVIRIADLCGARGWRLGAAVAAKHAYNKTREFKHGRKF